MPAGNHSMHQNFLHHGAIEGPTGCKTLCILHINDDTNAGAVMNRILEVLTVRSLRKGLRIMTPGKEAQTCTLSFRDQARLSTQNGLWWGEGGGQFLALKVLLSVLGGTLGS